jgi:predicted aminopeptidase
VKTIIIRILFYTGLWLVLTLLISYRMILYGVEQLNGQLNIIRKAVPVEQVLQDAAMPDSLKNKLRLIQQIRQFAFDSIGLKRNNNYTTFYEQHGRPLLWTLTACEPFNLKAYQWWFPFLGHLSYKGFFNKEKGEKEYFHLKSKGYDAELSPVNAWSTLGWFDDPILSSMLRRKEGTLAELVIHELTHATLYLKGQVEWNENLATFVGEQGAILFLRQTYGENSLPLNHYLQYKADQQTYTRHILKGAQRLDSLYRSPDFLALSFRDKLRAKYQLIARILLEVHDLDLYNKQAYLHDFRKEPLPDNTYFMSFLRYRKDQEVFERIFTGQCQRSLRTFIQWIREGHFQPAQ